MASPTRIALIFTALASLTVACSSPDPATDQAALDAAHSSGLTTPTTTTATPTTTGPAKSPRGLLIKKVGQAAGMGPSGGDADITFTLDNIAVDPTCSSPYADQPEHGHYIALKITVKTAASYDPNSSLATISQHDFEIVGSDGITDTEVASLGICMENDEYLTSDWFAPASQYGGLVVLDTKHASGTVVLRPAGMQGGWEWTF